MLNTNIIRYQ